MSNANYTKVNLGQLEDLKTSLQKTSSTIITDLEKYKAQLDSVKSAGYMKGIAENAIEQALTKIMNTCKDYEDYSKRVIDKIEEIKKNAETVDKEEASKDKNVYEEDPLSFGTSKKDSDNNDKPDENDNKPNNFGKLSSQDFKDTSYTRYYKGSWQKESLTDSQAKSANEMYNALKSEGLNDGQIAGIMGNAFIESSFDSTLKSLDTNGYYSHGCFQNNEAGRYSDFVKYCNSNGYSTKSTAAQAKYVAKVMANDSQFMSASDSTAGAKLAAERVRKIYEVSGSSEARQQNAANIYETIS